MISDVMFCNCHWILLQYFNIYLLITVPGCSSLADRSKWRAENGCGFTLVHLLQLQSQHGGQQGSLPWGLSCLSLGRPKPWLWEGSSCRSRVQEGQIVQLLDKGLLRPPAVRGPSGRGGGGEQGTEHCSDQTENARGGKDLVFLLAAQPTE